MKQRELWGVLPRLLAGTKQLQRWIQSRHVCLRPRPNRGEGGKGKFKLGDEVHDTDDDEPSAGYVTNVPETTAEEWTAYETATVAEDNSAYSSEAQVVVVVYENKLHHLAEWDRRTPLERSEIWEAGAKPYSFPAPRLAHGHPQSTGSSGSSEPEAAMTEDAATEVETEETEVQLDALGERLSGADWEI
jgi:hypothetical protein